MTDPRDEIIQQMIDEADAVIVARLVEIAALYDCTLTREAAQAIALVLDERL